MIHGQPVETMKKDQDFPISIEAQLLGGRGDGTARSTANLCTPGTNVVMNCQLETRHCINSSSKTFDGDQWVHVEIEVHGGGEMLTGGSISLHAESHPVEFRKVELLNLAESGACRHQ